MTDTLALNTPAPNFALKDASGTLHALDAYAGHPLVLIFYPGDMTPGCTMQLCAVRDAWSRFTELGASVLGVNHAGEASHRAFSETYHFPFPLLIDKGHKVSAAYGATRRFLGLTVNRRTVVVLDTAGKIIYYRHGLPKVADILKAVQSAQSERA